MHYLPCRLIHQNGNQQWYIKVVKREDFSYPQEPTRFSSSHLDGLLEHCVHHQASDITIQTDCAVRAEIYGRLYPVTTRRLTNTEVGDLLNAIYGQNGTVQILSGTDVDTFYEVKPSRDVRYRFRVNGTGCYINGHDGLQVTLRTIPVDPPSLESMQLEPDLREALTPFQGIVVVAGATGSGKSTLLSAIMRDILEQREGKVLTYESPIEFVYDNVQAPKALASQSEIPRNLPDYPSAIRNALRRKPTYILVGEARDADTIAAVIDAALTGHCVYTTVHSNGVADTIRRMVSVFPAKERYGRTLDLISLLRVVIWQALIPTNDGKRAPIREYLRFTDKVRKNLMHCNLGEA